MNYDNSKNRIAYTLSSRTDYTQIQPCCSSTDYIAASGITLNLAASPGSSSSSSSSTSNSYSGVFASNGGTWNYSTANNRSYMCSAMGIPAVQSRIACG